MFKIIILVAASIFLVLLVVNLYFRIKILKIYQRLVQGEVDFPPSYVLNKQKLTEDIIPKYPDYKDDILGLHKHLRISLGIAFVVFTISLFIGYQYVMNR